MVMLCGEYCAVGVASAGRFIRAELARYLKYPVIRVDLLPAVNSTVIQHPTLDGAAKCFWIWLDCIYLGPNL